MHVDGTRLGNAAVALGVPMSAMTTDLGVDVISLGGTKNGLLGAEAVVVVNPEAVVGPLYVRKLAMQPVSYTHLDVYKRQRLGNATIFCNEFEMTFSIP